MDKRPLGAGGAFRLDTEASTLQSQIRMAVSFQIARDACAVCSAGGADADDEFIEALEANEDRKLMLCIAEQRSCR